ncbi:dihydroxyacetone kinase family protein [Modestobacter sp. VKM Ac-2986]|uniref:dihydroxyacetone kinase family protein n=1 Tax=Modestobacter sp. VKM Ac-2986 TaxID=3004140 RepID=UPI0022AB0F91|nr:dihydroxyacetone kinase family protein [Modestobacter sp. VKM Ac-2986]MCZ2827724.1 dihydroxyacetone kinase family protein [Modestobacter sp. VKM Ac-2986]
MTRLVNEPVEFAAQALSGFAGAHPDHVLAVPGGVVRAGEPARGQVAIVLGGGSGHFPAFAGWIGPGLGHGAACGNVFASPAETQVLSVARAAESGGGVLFLPINYAGDILHFGAARDVLDADGVPARMVAVTDDIASGGDGEHAQRRGIAGSFLVVKVVGAAAERGCSLDEVERIARRANEATRSFGVAFSGCTLPGADRPLFEVPAGQVAVGLGIHGEPGIAQRPLGSADEVADLVVDGLFDERPPEAGRRVAVLVNGLGATKYDELHVVFARVAVRLEQAGMVLVAPVVGELVTSLDMAGLSVSLMYLDDELESGWLAGADTPAFSRGPAAAAAPRRVLQPQESPAGSVSAGSPASHAVAVRLVGALAGARAAVLAEESALGELDAVAGDGDHGAGMARGITAALRAAQDAVAAGAGAGSVLAVAGQAWSDVGGGTSGALWGAALREAGQVVGDERLLGGPDLLAAVAAFRESVQARGGARPGDKTMVDALVPFAEALQAAVAGDAPMTAAWDAAATAADHGARRTAGYPARLGRARTHGASSVGTSDPGAVSFALVVRAVADVLAASPE